MGAEDERLQNFVDLAAINPAMLVPAVASAILCTAIFKTWMEKRFENDMQKSISKVACAGVFFTTFIDSANVVSALTLERSSSAGILQIVGASLHLVGSFFWRGAVGIEPPEGQQTQQGLNDLMCAALTSGLAVILGEILETTAVILTLRDTFLVPAVCHVSIAGALGTVWICMAIQPSNTNDYKATHLTKARQPVVWVGQILYIGIVAVAAVQDLQNIYLLFPEVPLDLVEDCMLRRVSAGKEDEDDSTTGTSAHS